MKRRILTLGLLSLCGVALATKAVDAWGGGAGTGTAPHWRHHHHNKFTTTITVRPYNAFTPIAWGNLVCDGCVPNPCGVSMGVLPMSFGVPPFAANTMCPPPMCMGDACGVSDMHMRPPMHQGQMPNMHMPPGGYPFMPMPMPQPHPQVQIMPMPMPMPMPGPGGHMFPGPMPQPFPGPGGHMPQPFAGPGMQMFPGPMPQPMPGPMPQGFPGPMPQPMPRGGPIGSLFPSLPSDVTQASYASYPHNATNLGWMQSAPSYWYGTGR